MTSPPRCVSWNMRVDVFTIPSRTQPVATQNSTRRHTREVSWDTQIDVLTILARERAHDDTTPVSKGAERRVACSNEDTARSSLAAQPATGASDNSTRRHSRSVSWNTLIEVFIIPARDTTRHAGLTPTRVSL